MVKTNKKIGLGSLSILLWVFGILFSFTFGNQGALGDRLLEAIGLSAWSNGDTGIHYTILYSYLFFVPSLLLARQFRENLGAILGGRLSLLMCVWLGIMSLSF